MDVWVRATGARHSKSLERRSQRTACLRGRLKFTLMCTFLVKAESGGYQTWIYMGRLEERLAQQKSGATLSNSSTYVSGLLLYKVCIN